MGKRSVMRPYFSLSLQGEGRGEGGRPECPSPSRPADGPPPSPLGRGYSRQSAFDFNRKTDATRAKNDERTDKILLHARHSGESRNPGKQLQTVHRALDPGFRRG
jgi:hypothetical protein